MKFYNAFGLRIRSELTIPQFHEVNSKDADVEILFEDVPSSISKTEENGIVYEANENEFLMKLEKIAYYYVKDGEKISIQKKCNDENEIRLFLIAPVISALLHQRSLMPIHASAVIKNKKAILFSGRSGSGKSTLAAHMLKYGFSLHSDDISSIKIIENTAYSNPGYPGLKLWDDAIQKIDTDFNRSIPLRTGINKFHNSISQFYSKPAKICCLFILEIHHFKNLIIEELKGIEKFDAIRKNIYRRRFAVKKVTHEEYFKTIQIIARQSSIFRITRPKKPNLLDDIIKIISEKIENLI
ncbi:hypothetical protein ACFLSA_01360 [Bacteroidota bacterium]